jgi:hypothetical protein
MRNTEFVPRAFKEFQHWIETDSNRVHGLGEMAGLIQRTSQ